MNQNQRKQIENGAKPFRLFFHPLKRLIDDIIMYIMYNIFLRLHRFHVLPLTLESSKTRSCLLSFRNLCQQSSPQAIATELNLWNQLYKKTMNDNVLKSSTREFKDFMCNIPRLNNILSKWDISSYIEASKDTKNEFVKLSIFSCTNHIQPEKQETCNEVIESNKLSIGNLKQNLGDLPSSVQIILHFWGGGMTVDGNSGEGRQLTRFLCEANQNVESIIHICPYYRLAPENPFPSSVIDALSVIDFLIQNVPKNVRIHVSGLSAGGNLAAVTVLEAHRRFPGRIKSVYLWDPMLEPRCDTMSFYLNSNSGLATWIAWSWRSYLSLDNDLYIKKATNKDGKVIIYKTYDDYVMHGSNQEVYKQSTILSKYPEITRLCEPKIGITATLSSEDAPLFIVSTSSGDPLRDDGLQFGTMLRKNGANVKMIESRSSHGCGMFFDSTFKKNIIKELGNVIFGEK